MRYAFQRLLNRAGYRFQRRYPRDLLPEVLRTIERVEPFTMTSPESIAAVCDATEYVARRQLPGAIVECGVWKGGSMMAAALTLDRLGAGDRDLFLFDTFAGMPEPSQADVRYDGLSASDPKTIQPQIAVGRSDVDRALASTGYDSSRVHLVEGRVEDTLPAAAPLSISLLRLDTDWYESTKHELVHLYPRLEPGGVLILDDYGHWLGARRAVDEYLAEHGIALLFCRVDYTVRMAVKP